MIATHFLDNYKYSLRETRGVTKALRAAECKILKVEAQQELKVQGSVTTIQHHLLVVRVSRSRGDIK